MNEATTRSGGMGGDLERRLKEISGSGAIRAARSLGELLGMEVELQAPVVRMGSIEDAVARFPDDRPSFGIFIGMEGDFRNNFLFLISEDDSRKLASILIDEEAEDLDLSEDSMAISSLKEIGNILASSFSNDLGDRWDMNTHPTPPDIDFDLPRTLVSFVLIQFSRNSESTLVFHTALKVKDEKFRIDLLMVPAMEELEKLCKMSLPSGQFSGKDEYT